MSGLPEPVRFFGGINGFIKATAKQRKQSNFGLLSAVKASVITQNRPMKVT